MSSAIFVRKLGHPGKGRKVTKRMIVTSIETMLDMKTLRANVLGWKTEIMLLNDKIRNASILLDLVDLELHFVGSEHSKGPEFALNEATARRKSLVKTIANGGEGSDTE